MMWTASTVGFRHV